MRADSVSSRYTTLVERQTASPVIVIAAMTSVSPRKFGPPESPYHVPPLPVEGFIEIRSQLGFVEFSVPVATMRTSL